MMEKLFPTISTLSGRSARSVIPNKASADTPSVKPTTVFFSALQSLIDFFLS